MTTPTLSESDATVLSRIVLTGFMGAGKSTVGPLLASRLAWSYLDADEVIESEAGIAIAEIFARFGEAEFRSWERETIQRLIVSDRLVLSLGGGAIENVSTREMLLASPGTILVHLDVGLDTALARCSGAEQTRPLLADRENLARRYQRRLPLYRTAHFSISVDTLTPDEVVDAILAAAQLP
jgi:shikimate kinase